MCDYELWEIIVPEEGCSTWITRLTINFGNDIFYDVSKHKAGFVKALLLIDPSSDNDNIKDVCQFTMEHFKIQFINTYRVSNKAIIAYINVDDRTK